MKQCIEIWTDGACSGNPGPGGWAVLLRSGNNEKCLKGGDLKTTNNRMELIATIEALKALKKPCKVNLYTDSAYVKGGITNWINTWKKNSWKTANKKPVKNIDLWKELDNLGKIHCIDWHWVKGHSGVAENDLVDRLAREAVKNFKTNKRSKLV